jgi:hypothetical protein
MPSFTVSAWIAADDTWRHDRLHDHSGMESDAYVELSVAIGGYPAGTPIADVLVSIMDRIWALENAERRAGTFTIDAILTDRVIPIDAVISKTSAAAFTIDAFLSRGGSFTIDAFIAGRFTIDAIIV